MTDFYRAAAEASAIAAGWDARSGPGGAIVLFDGKGIRGEAAGGFADLSHKLPFTPDTAGRYASISKHIFATLLLSLKGDHAFALDGPLRDHLPILNGEQADVTVGRALDMTGGLADTMETFKLLGGSSTTSLGREALLSFVTQIEGLNFPQGSEISYSNTGYRLLQAAVEAKTGTKVAALLRDRFFKPLGLQITMPYDETDPVPNLATGYWRHEERGWLAGRYGPFISASGGLAGSARTLARWLCGLLAAKGNLAGVLDQLAAPRTLSDGRATGYGLGMAETQFGGRVFHGHGGSLPGYRDHFLLDRDHGSGVVVITNSDDADALGLTCRVMAALAGVEPPKPASSFAARPGLYTTATGPFWAEYASGSLTFIGAQQALFEGGEGEAISNSAHLPMHLRPDGDAITGEIGHVPYRFLPVANTNECDPTWLGSWTSPHFHAGFSIARTGSGMAIATGTGPVRITAPLQPIGAGRALFERADSPGAQRVCIEFSGDEARLVIARSRVLRFQRDRH